MHHLKCIYKNLYNCLAYKQSLHHLLLYWLLLFTLYIYTIYNAFACLSLHYNYNIVKLSILYVLTTKHCTHINYKTILEFSWPICHLIDYLLLYITSTSAGLIAFILCLLATALTFICIIYKICSHLSAI